LVKKELSETYFLLEISLVFN